jgi:hypothetical protein
VFSHVGAFEVFVHKLRLKTLKEVECDIHKEVNMVSQYPVGIVFFNKDLLDVLRERVLHNLFIYVISYFYFSNFEGVNNYLNFDEFGHWGSCHTQHSITYVKFFHLSNDFSVSVLSRGPVCFIKD